jgi:hypothetical protein
MRRRHDRNIIRPVKQPQQPVGGDRGARQVDPSKGFLQPVRIDRHAETDMRFLRARRRLRQLPAKDFGIPIGSRIPARQRPTLRGAVQVSRLVLRPRPSVIDPYANDWFREVRTLW